MPLNVLVHRTPSTYRRIDELEASKYMWARYWEYHCSFIGFF